MMNKINSFPLDENENGTTNVLFFDIFFKNNKIYLILPIYNQPYSSDAILLKVNKNPMPLIVTTKYIKNEYEPILIYVYDYISNDNQTMIDVSIEYKNKIRLFTLEHIVTMITSNTLTLTTLFKDDYKTFSFFYKYYKNQGVSHFYLYYNGKITSKIKKKILNKKKDVTLIEWDFHYWNDMDNGQNLYKHHAQMGQIHHAIYRYGKELNDYMIFCDFDEYLYIPRNSLLQFITHYPMIDIIGFCNKWADNATVPDTFPSKLMTSTPFNYGIRSKNIYKLSVINTIYIHVCRDFNTPNIQGYVDFYLFHFYKWSDPNRIIREECNIEENIYLC
jgi:hypothetical protein